MTDEQKKQNPKQQQKQQPKQQQPKKDKGAPEPEVPAGPAPTPRLKKMFDETVSAKLGEQFGLKNPMQRPKLSAIVINVNMGRHLEGTKIPPNIRSQVLETLTTITGQRPVVLK